MTITELDEQERLALLGVLKLIVRADKKLSGDEVVTLKELAETMGQAEFRTAVEGARQRFKSASDAKAFAESVVQRPEARRLIYETALKAGVQGGLVEQEAAELRWLAQAWSIAVDPTTCQPI